MTLLEHSIPLFALQRFSKSDAHNVCLSPKMSSFALALRLLAHVLPLLFPLGCLPSAAGARARDIVQLAYKTMVLKGVPLEQVIVDVSQDASRKPWSVGCRSLTTSSTLFSFSRGRIIRPREHQRIMGFPLMSLPNFPEGVWRDLCGEAMAVPSVTLVTLCAVLASTALQ